MAILLRLTTRVGSEAQLWFLGRLAIVTTSTERGPTEVKITPPAVPLSGPVMTRLIAIKVRNTMTFKNNSYFRILACI